MLWTVNKINWIASAATRQKRLMWYPADGRVSALRMRAHPLSPADLLPVPAADDQLLPLNPLKYVRADTGTHMRPWQPCSGRSRSAFTWKSSGVMVSHARQRLFYGLERQFVGASSLFDRVNPFNSASDSIKMRCKRQKRLDTSTYMRIWCISSVDVYLYSGYLHEPLAYLRIALWCRLGSWILSRFPDVAWLPCCSVSH